MSDAARTFNYPLRIDAIRRVLEVRNMDGLIVTGPSSLRYLLGFTGSNGFGIITQDKTLFFTDFRYRSQAAAEVVCDKIIIVKGELFSRLNKNPAMKKIRRLGFESSVLSHADFIAIKKQTTGTALIPTTDLIESLASIKDQSEIALHAKAVEITDRVFAKILGIIKPGMREADIAAEISYWHRRFGADGDAFEPIVASGTRGSLPHGIASSKKIKSSELVTLDFGCRFRGYCSDLTRTISVGNPSSLAKRVYQIVLDAQELAENVAHEGMTAKHLDAVARGYIRQKEFGKYFGHGLGHGLGLQVHALPKVSSRSTHVLQAGQIITIEPGIYLPHQFGVRIEDDVIIRSDCCEILTTAPKRLLIL